jgi:hypothetical protein
VAKLYRVSKTKAQCVLPVPLDSQIFPRTITDAFESLKWRVGLFDEETGNLGHPLFATRPEKRVLLGVKALSVRPGYCRRLPIDNCDS